MVQVSHRLRMLVCCNDHVTSIKPLREKNILSESSARSKIVFVEVPTQKDIEKPSQKDSSKKTLQWVNV